MYKILALISSFLIFESCKTQNAASDKESLKQSEAKVQNMWLKEGENIALATPKVTLTFETIIEDSRCPEDVQCVWAGAVVAKINIKKGNSQPIIFNISNINHGTKYLQTQYYEGYNISFKEVVGSKTQGKPYQIKLKIEKGEPTTTLLPSSL